MKETVSSFFTCYAGIASGTGQRTISADTRESRIRDRVRFVMRKSEFYRSHYSGCDTSDIWNLPVTNKKLMMENLGTFNTLGLDKQEIMDFCVNAEKTRDFSKRLRGVTCRPVIRHKR